MNDETTTQRSGDGSSASTGRLTTAMRRVLWAVCAVVVVALISAVWLAGATGPGSSSGSSSGSGSSADETAGTHGDGQPASASTPMPGPHPSATPMAGSEVQMPSADPSETGRIPQLPATTPLITPPLPEQSSAEGELVKGFPSEVMGPANDSDIVSTSIAAEGSTMQVTLIARTDTAPEDILAHFRALWSGLDLTDQGTEISNGVAYSGRQASLTLGFSPDSATGTVYTILGSFRTD